MCVMKIAHSNATYGVMMFGGKKSEYFAMALRLAHKGVDLMANYSRKLVNVQLINLRIETLENKLNIFNKTLDIIFIIMFAIFITLFASLFSQASANENRYCLYNEGIESSIIIENKNIKNLDDAREFCPGYVITETKKSDDESCKQELAKVKKIFKYKYECFYE